MIARGVTFAALVAVTVVAVVGHGPPAARPASAPADEFSAERARRHLTWIAAEPHPVGSPAHAAVRARLIGEVTALGLEVDDFTRPFIHAAWGNPFPVATVHDVVARRPGIRGGDAILIMAHYDSTPVGPGAADDGAAVAAMLETARALMQAAPARNDVIFLFSDAEEAGLVGAAAFVAGHPWMADVRVVLNFEARGSAGPSLLFEAIGDHAGLIARWAAAAPTPIGNSLAAEVYRRMANDTDLSVFRDRDVVGLNFAFIERVHGYHGVGDTVGALDLDSVQHHGDTMLALARALGDADLRAPGGGAATWFNPLGRLVIVYPTAWAPSFAALALALAAAVIALGVRRDGARPGAVALAAVVALLVVVVAAVVAVALWTGLSSAVPAYRVLPWGPASDRLLLAAVGLLVGALVLGSASAGLRRLCSRDEVAIGVMAPWIVLTLLSVIVAPGAAWAFTWPLVGLACAQIAPRRALSASALGALPALLLWAPLIRDLHAALAMDGIAVTAALLALVALALLAVGLQLVARPGRIARTLAVAGVLAAAAAATDDSIAPPPAPTGAVLALDADTSTARWLTDDGATPASPPLLPAPSLLLVGDDRIDGRRRLRLAIASARGAPQLILALGDRADIEAVTIGDQRLDRSALARDGEGAGELVFHWWGAGRDEIVTVELAAGVATIPVRLTDVSFGDPRPTTADHSPMPFGFGVTDATQVSRSLSP